MNPFFVIDKSNSSKTLQCQQKRDKMDVLFVVMTTLKGYAQQNTPSKLILYRKHQDLNLKLNYRMLDENRVSCHEYPKFLRPSQALRSISLHWKYCGQRMIAS